MYPEKSRHLGYLVDPCSICIFFHRSIYIHRSTCHRRRRTSRRTRSFRRSLRRWRIPTSTRRLVLGWGGDGARVWLGEKIGGVVKFFTEFLYRPNCFFCFFLGERRWNLAKKYCPHQKWGGFEPSPSGAQAAGSPQVEPHFGTEYWKADKAEAGWVFEVILCCYFCSFGFNPIF